MNEMESMNGITDVCVYIHTKLLYYVSILQKFIKKKAIKFVFDGDRTTATDSCRFSRL